MTVSRDGVAFLGIDNPVGYGIAGNAILGIKESGKSYCATLIAERLFGAGIPFITFDPVGVWRFLRAPGRGKGYPVVVAGGEDGDLPLTVKGAPEIVRAAMVGGVSLVIDLHDIRLSKADWRRIVTSCVRVLLFENAPHGMRHVFLEEAAEFVPQKVLDGEVYAEVEKLARMGGNARLGYTLINPRSQEINKAVLELCENLLLFRQCGKNALDSLDKWLAIAGAVAQKEIIASLPDLPSGQCWAWIGGESPKPPKLIKVPGKNSLHPDRRVLRGDEVASTTQRVDVGRFVEGMRGSLIKIEEEAKANDPAALKAEIARLKREIAAGPAKLDPQALSQADATGFARGVAEGRRRDLERWHAFRGELHAIEGQLKTLLVEIAKNAEPGFGPIEHNLPASRPRPRIVHSAPPPDKGNTDTASAALSTPQRKILTSLVFWMSIGHAAPTRPMVAAVAGYAPSSGGFNNLIGSMRSAGLIDIPAAGRVGLTAAGAAADMTIAMSTEEARNFLLSILSTPQRKLVEVAAGCVEITREDLATATQYSAGSGGFNNLIGSLCTIDIFTKPRAGVVALSDWARMVL